MKTITKFISTVAVLALALQQPSRAQMSVSNEPERPSAEAWNFIQYGEVNPSLYTGTLRLSIPFYTYKDPDFELPISLEYATNGHIPNIVPGILGPDWTLNAGGYITREIRGVPDDKDGNIHETVAKVLTAKAYLKLFASDLDISNAELCSSWDDYLIGDKCYYYFPSETGATPDCYDAEPDIFHFSFMGYSGSFHLGPNGEVVIYGTNVSNKGIRIEISSDFNLNTPISITTSDGYRYEFDGRVGDQYGTSTDVLYDGGSTISAWRLSRIVAPNGRKLELNYRKTVNAHTLRPYTICWSVATTSEIPDYPGDSSTNFGGKRLMDSESWYSIPQNITVDGDTLAVFSYEAAPTERYHSPNKDYDNESVYVTRMSVPKLSGIRIRRGGKDIKTCGLSYNTEAKSKTGFLSTVTISGEGTFSMEYYRNDLCPMYGTFKIDHWGYYNGKSSNYRNYLGATSLDDNNDETIMPGSPRLPDGYVARYGTLSKITYPTGGWTLFSYVPHDYSREVLQRSENEFNQALVDSSGQCGGIRISQISSYGTDGTLLDQRTYEYKDGNTSSGVLTYMPRYKLRHHVKFAGTEQWGSIWTNNLTRFGGNHIEYGTVTERRRDGSSVRYKFRTWEDDPDKVAYRNLRPESNRYLGSYTLWPDSLAVLFVARTKDPSRGSLMSKESIDADGNTVACESSTFSCLTPSSSFSWVPRYIYFSTADVGLWTGREDVSSRTESLVFGERRVTRTTSYAYNSDFLRTEERASDSRGTESLLRRSYVTEASSGVAKLMADAGMVGFPLSETRLVRPAGGQERVVSVAEYSYVQPAPVAHPSLFRVGSVMETDSTTGVRSVTSYTYDPLGRPLTRTAPDGTVTVYVWGYGGLYPVAAVSGTTLQAVRNVPELRSLQYGPIEGALSAESESGLRAISGAEVTVWEYEPLVGLTRETGPDGTSVSYTYNASGKLHEVLDALGRASGAYLYSTDNKTDTSL